MMAAAQRDVTEAREQLMRGTLRACIEGGSRFWLAGKPVRRDDSTDVVGFFYAGIEECRAADGDSDERFDNVTLATIELGFRRLIDGSATASRTVVAAARRAFLEPDDGDIDAEAADVILQAGLFGSVVHRRAKVRPLIDASPRRAS